MDESIDITRMNLKIINCVAWKEPEEILVHTIWFHLYEILENANKSVLDLLKKNRWVSVMECGSELEGWGRLTQRHEEILDGDGYVHGLDCSDDSMGMYTCSNLLNCKL